MVQAQNMKIVPIILPGVAVNNDDFVGARDDATPVSVDTNGWDYATFVVQFGALDANVAEFTLSECDTTDGTFVDITGAGWTLAGLPVATTDNGETWAIQVDLSAKRNRYFQINLKAGNATGSYAVAFAILTRAEQAPDTAAERGFDQEIIL